MFRSAALRDDIHAHFKSLHWPWNHASKLTAVCRHALFVYDQEESRFRCKGVACSHLLTSNAVCICKTVSLAVTEWPLERSHRSHVTCESQFVYFTSPLCLTLSCVLNRSVGSAMVETGKAQYLLMLTAHVLHFSGIAFVGFP